ncbi:MAG TPA: A/G-specific adenine glycosylase [Verrucomicrobiota bacterium]|nr:A/G-specific adenine glycosylase [Verrucomicrobiota bacterium]
MPLLLSWFSANARDLPWRRTRDPYAIWVSEIMLQQTQVKTVIPYWERWMRELPDVQSLANASESKIHKLWEGLGYYARVRNMQKAAQQIVESCRSRGNESQTKRKSETPHVVSYMFPENFDDVLALPGIGRYTAGAICSIAFNQPTPILDGNVIRVLTRVFGISGDPREKKTNACLWQLAKELVVHASRITHHASPCSHLNQSLMELGALICTPRSPRCDICPVKKLCVAFREGRQEQLPNLGKRVKATDRRFIAFVVERNGRFLVRQRPNGVVNAHLWEFPNIEVELSKGGARHSVRAGASQPPNGVQGTDAPYLVNHFQINSEKPLAVIKHSITRYRITLEAWRAELVSRDGAPVSDPARSRRATRNTPDRRSAFQGQWLTLSQLRRLAFASAHRKILSSL